jgi:hypothetical protein
MRVLIVNTDYPLFLERFAAEHPGLATWPYEQQLAARNDSLFGVADFYSRNLRRAGCEAWEVHANHEILQKTWSREHGVDFGPPTPPPAPPSMLVRGLARLPVLGRRFRRRRGLPPWLLPILTAQIEHYRPDVILNHDTYMIPGRFLAAFKPAVRLVVGQIASPLPAHGDWSGYDLVMSSLPNLIEAFRAAKVPAEYAPLGFDPVVLDRVPEEDRTLPVLFVGSFSSAHAGRIRLLEALCRRIDIHVWGTGLAALAPDSPIRAHWRGDAWGIDMYRLLRRARITLNQHIDMAGQHANNCRLFEATGTGTLLLTDRKSDLGRLFRVGEEVVDYGDVDECARRIGELLGDEPRRAAIAAAGQRRTLAEHTYERRMAELAALFRRYLAAA